MAEIEQSELDFVGNQLRSINQEIKVAFAEMAGKQVPADVARAVHNAQLAYDQGREAYTTVYRAIWGSVPTGLTGAGLGIALPVGIAAWGVWQWLIGALAIGGLIYTAMATMRDVVRIWRERQLIGAGATGTDILQAPSGVDPMWILGGVGVLGVIILLKD